MLIHTKLSTGMSDPEATGSLTAAPPSAPPTRLWSSLAEAVREIWQSRELLYQLMLRDIRIRYKQAVMGFGWAILMPIMIVGAGLIVRVVLSTTGVTSGAAGLAGTAAKGICWSFFAGAVGFGTSSLVANVNLVSKVYFPREVLPLASVGAQTFDTFIAAVALAIALPFLGLVLSPALLWLPLLALLLVALTSASALFLSCANLFLRDVKYIVQLLLTFGIFFTPVLIEPAMLGPLGAKLCMLNPLAPILEGVRLALAGQNLLHPIVEHTAKGIAVLAWQPWYLLYSAVWALGGLVASLLIFHRLEFIFAEYL
jgi:homopolymeric O-antigen transport system permease protein